MSQDTTYSAVLYLYQSRGLIARSEIDRAPEYTYLQMMNMLEREESSMSSRFGTQIINRDPQGVGTNNYFFNSPITSLSRLNYQSSAWRYVGLGNGTLQRRAGNTQGQYSPVQLPVNIDNNRPPLSGQPFTSLITNCFETSQAYLFIYDQAQSIKDNGTFATAQLTGIDPSQYTLNVLPYAPLLIMIDSFAAANVYENSGLSAWGWGALETLNANSGQLVTDFSQFFGITPASGGATYDPSSATATVTVTASSGNTVTGTSGAASGFASVVPSFGETVSLTVEVGGSFTVLTPGGGGEIDFQYSEDGGTTWTTFFSFVASGFTETFTTQSVSVSIDPSNLALVQVRIFVSATASGPPTAGQVEIEGDILNVYATIVDPAAFDPVANGMIALLNTNTLVTVPIVIATSTDLVGGIYQQLLVTTSAAHGLSPDDLIAIYASSSDIVDGFYQVVATPSSTTFSVDFLSAAQIGAAGGYVTYTTAATVDANVPYACVLTDEYSSPYPSQLSAWGFYQWVTPTTTAFPVGAWSGTIAAASSTGTIGVSATFDLNQNNQVTDDDLIVITLLTSNPANIEQIELQFFVGSGGNNYYSAFISPAYYQGAVDGNVLAYQATESQILADTLGLISGQPPGTTSAQLQPTNISTGSGSWQACYIPRGNFLPVGQAGQAGVDWSNVTGWKLSVTTNTNGGASFSVNGLYLQWGYGPSSFAGVGYDWRQTYYSANTGTESSPCPEQQFNTDFGYLSSTSAPIFLRQAAQVVGQYSFDPQVTHVRLYRRGGTLNDNWVQTVQAPNITGGGQFVLKDVIGDSFIQQAQPLVLDNDPPVTSSLVNPIQTTLAFPTTLTGLSSIYSTFSPQNVVVAQTGAVFVPNQLVEVGNANNLEVVAVVAGGIGTFTAILRLMHNQGEPVNVYAVPRQPCNLCATAYNQVWLAGDPNNPHYLYFSKPGLPENFGPQNYIPVGTPDAPINAVINWRGTLFVGTSKTWWIIPGSQRAPQPTGSVHGIVAQGGWIEVEGAIWYRAADGLREFTGAEGVYKSLPIEWIYINNPQCIPPQADKTQAAADVMAFYNNQVIVSYISLNSGQRYRNVWDTNYQRYRQDDVAATAMLWEKDTNLLLVGKELSPGNYVVVQDQIGDYDDGGWLSGSLVQTPIDLTIQHPYRDLGKPHEAKNWNTLETDVNTQGQVLNTTLLFEDGAISIPLTAINTGMTRQKAESTVNSGSGQEAYRASILHTMAVTIAPTLYQEAINAAVLPAQTASYDSYEIKFGTDLSKFIKQGYFDYTSPVPINVSLYADGNYPTPYFTFQLPARPDRGVIRVRFGNLNSGTTAFTMRTWRMIMLAVSATDPLQTFQLWKNPRIEWKSIESGHNFEIKELNEV